MRVSGRARLGLVVFGVLVLLVLGAVTAGAQEADDDGDPTEGRVVYESRCAACHQPDGSGVAGAFPALAGNENLADAGYVSGVILQGVGAMPAFALDDDELEDLLAFLQEEFAPEAPEPTEPEPAEPDEPEPTEPPEPEPTTPPAPEPTAAPDPTAAPEPEPIAEPPSGDASADRLAAEGRVVYEANCAGCHQLDGSGGGPFPALAGNPRTADAEFVTGIVRQGQGSMPAFPALSDEDVEALTVFLARGFAAPPPAPPPGDAGDVAGTELPSGIGLVYGLGFLVFLLAAGFVAGPYVFARSDAGPYGKAQVWLKAATIFVYFVVATVMLPSWVTEWSALATPPGFLDAISAGTWNTIRDILATLVWLVALGLGMWALRRGQRERMI